MKAVLQAFLQDLADLQQHINDIDNEANILAEIAEMHGVIEEGIALEIKRSLLSGKRRRFTYNSIIVSLYGFFEQYIELLIKEYLASLNTIIPNYKELPESITKHHIELSVVLISKVDMPKYRGEIKVEDVISNLHSGLSNSKDYKINLDAFAYHTANFRADSIDQIFGRLGIDNLSTRAKSTRVFSEYIKKTQLDRINPEDVLFYLNDLAERRNEVAHGSGTDILSNDVLKGYILFLTNFGQSIFELVNSELSKYRVEHKSIELGKAINVFNNDIVCLKTKSQIKVGDLLIAKTSSNNLPFLSSEILEIQVNKKNKGQVPPGTTLGMKVSFHAKKTYTYYIMSTE